MNFRELFGKTKPILAMLHLKAGKDSLALTRAKEEIEIFYTSGIDAILVENYFGSVADCEDALRYLQENYADKIYGVNILGDYRKAFELAEKYGAKFIQIDSVCGHLHPKADFDYGEDLKRLRSGSSAIVLGGVRFKYQPVNSKRSLDEDLAIGMERCEGIVVTGEGTGTDSPDGKIAEFRNVVGEFPLIVGAGVTVDTVARKLELAEGIIIGSWLKEGHVAEGRVSREYVREFMGKVKETLIKD